MKDELQPVNDTWLSGKPYYCEVCGLGMGEYMACEEVACCLESAESAQKRLAKERRKLP